MFTYEFERPAVTVDAVGLRVTDGALSVLLVKRDAEPFAGSSALPGGFVRMDEPLEAAVGRVLSTKASLSGLYIEQLASFGDVGRDPRGRTISISYLAVFPGAQRYEGPGEWHAVDSVPELAFDHAEILRAAIERVRAKIGYSSLALRFLPDTFTLTEAQRVHEAILGQPVDKRNYRKALLARDIVRATGKKSTGGAHPPAALYVRAGKELRYW